MKRLVLFILFPLQIFAANVYFIPGDAVFHTMLKGEDLKKTSEGSLLLQCSYPWVMMLCGNIGYRQIEYTDVSQKKIDNLLKIYTEFEGNISEETELKQVGLYAYILNKDFDFNRYIIGLKYNEDWLEEHIAFGARQSHTNVYSYLPRYIGESWRDSMLVAPLKSTAKFEKQTNSTKRIIPKVSSKDTIIVVCKQNIGQVYKESFGEIYIFQGDQLQKYRYQSSKWELITD
ncbi:MAG: hypothetical protein MK193_03580 [Lentisphaeria bacterium]|nr:hypothetical protein [Lentisphaeria bacterium]